MELFYATQCMYQIYVRILLHSANWTPTNLGIKTILSYCIYQIITYESHVQREYIYYQHYQPIMYIDINVK
jgi:hypothetical protein